MSKLGPKFAEPATAVSLSTSFPDVLHEKLAGDREIGNVFPMHSQYRVSTSTGWFLQQNRVKYHFGNKQTNKFLCEQIREYSHYSWCVRLQFRLRLKSGYRNCVKF